MPPPFKVALVDHDPRWSASAQTEASVLQAALCPNLLTVHHVRSTAVPGLRTKPILDLLPVARGLDDLDLRRNVLEQACYELWGEFGPSGRRYAAKTEPDTGRRLVQLHCCGVDAPDIDRHLAFRSYLRKRPGIVAVYQHEKAHCRELHPDDSQDYGAGKSAWIEAVQAAALADWQRS
ncbi:GrpB family protein [Methylobacterium sp. P5_C11]